MNSGNEDPTATAIAELREQVAGLQKVVGRNVVLAATSATATIAIGEQLAAVIEASGQEWTGREALGRVREQLSSMIAVLEEMGRD